MSSEALDSLDDVLYCAICTLPYDEYGHKPKALPCLHTCCLTCLNRHVTASRTYNRFPCPFCRAMTTMPPSGGVNRFPDNFYLRQMADYRHARPPSPPHSAPCDVCTTGDQTDIPVHNAVLICLDCGIRLCQDCADRHSTLPVTKDHSLRELSTKNLPCKEHPNSAYQYYCEAHTQCICITCYQRTHSDCAVRPINEAAAEKKNYLRRLDNACEANQRMLREQLVVSSDQVAELEQQLQEALNTKHALEFSLKQFTPSNLGNDAASGGMDEQVHLLENYPQLNDKLSRLSDLQCYEDLTKFVIFKEQFGGDLTGPIDIVALSNNATVAAELVQNSFKIYDKDGSLTISCSTTHCSSDSIRSRLTAKDESFIRAYNMYHKLYLETWNSEGGVSSLRELRGDTNILQNLYPSGIAVAPDGTVVIGDTLGKMHLFTQTGQYMQTIHTHDRSDTDTLHPNYIVINSLGHIFFSDIKEDCIKVYNLDGALLHTFGGHGSKLGELHEPEGLCLWEGNVIVADHKNDRVCMFSRDGNFLANLVTRVPGPTSVAIQDKNELVICSNHSGNSYELLVYDLKLVA